MQQASFEQQLAWTKQHMTRSLRALAYLPDLEGVRLACSLHLDLKMLPLVEGLLAKGADLFIVTCNPTTVRDQVADAMRQKGALAISLARAQTGRRKSISCHATSGRR